MASSLTQLVDPWGRIEGWIGGPEGPDVPAATADS